MTQRTINQLDFLNQQERQELEEFNLRVRKASIQNTPSKLKRALDEMNNNFQKQENSRSITPLSNYSNRNISTKKYQPSSRISSASKRNTPLEEEKNPWRHLRIDTAPSAAAGSPQQQQQIPQNQLMSSSRSLTLKTNDSKFQQNGHQASFQTPIQQPVHSQDSRPSSKCTTPQGEGNNIFSNKQAKQDVQQSLYLDLLSNQQSQRSSTQKQASSLQKDQEYLKLVQAYNQKNVHHFQHQSFGQNTLKNNSNILNLQNSTEIQSNHLANSNNSMSASNQQLEKSSSKYNMLLQQQQQQILLHTPYRNCNSNNNVQLPQQQSLQQQQLQNNSVKNRLQIPSIKDFESTFSLSHQSSSRQPFYSVQLEDNNDKNNKNKSHKENGIIGLKKESQTNINKQSTQFQIKQEDDINQIVISPQFKSQNSPSPSSTSSHNFNFEINPFIKQQQLQAQEYQRDAPSSSSVYNDDNNRRNKESQLIQNKLIYDDNDSTSQSKYQNSNKNVPKNNNLYNKDSISNMVKSSSSEQLRLKDLKDRLTSKLSLPYSKDNQYLISLIINHSQSCNSFAVSLSRMLQSQ